MSHLDPWYDLRSKIVEALIEDLVGTAAETTLNEDPLDRFVMGILYPRSDDDLDDVPDLPESAEGAGADAVVDPAVALSHRQYPSSIGCTFAVEILETQEIAIQARAVRFEETVDSG